MQSFSVERLLGISVTWHKCLWKHIYWDGNLAGKIYEVRDRERGMQAVTWAVGHCFSDTGQGDGSSPAVNEDLE